MQARQLAPRHARNALPEDGVPDARQCREIERRDRPLRNSRRITWGLRGRTSLESLGDTSYGKIYTGAGAATRVAEMFGSSQRTVVDGTIL